MRIALSSPVDVHELARHCGIDVRGIPTGLGSTVVTPLTIEFLRRGHQVTVFTLSPDLDSEQVLDWGNLRIMVGPMRSQHLARNYFRPEIAYLKRMIKAENPPFVHAHWTYEFALAALQSGAPALVTVHDLPWAVLRYFKDAYRAVRLLMAYDVALKGKNFTAVSVQTARHFRRYFRPATDIRVIPNAVPDRILNIRSAREWGRGGFVFATILQGWTTQKNAGVALEAFRQVRREIPGVRLLMFGLDYQPGGPAELWAKQHDAIEGVTFAGSVPYSDLLNTVANEVDAIVHPSLNEAFSMVSLESLALRKVFIAGQDTPNMSIVLEGGKNGLLVNVRDPASVAQAMVSVAKNPELCEQLSSSGYDFVSTQYRLDRITGMYEDAYRLISTS